MSLGSCFLVVEDLRFLDTLLLLPDFLSIFSTFEHLFDLLQVCLFAAWLGPDFTVVVAS